MDFAPPPPPSPSGNPLLFKRGGLEGGVEAAPPPPRSFPSFPPFPVTILVSLLNRLLALSPPKKIDFNIIFFEIVNQYYKAAKTTSLQNKC